MKYLFDLYVNGTNKQLVGNISSWDVSNVTNMRNMFAGYFISDFPTFIDGVESINFNQDISSWDVSNVTNMESMFQNNIFNQNISSWDVSNVTNMNKMFFGNLEFNQDISSWDVSSVENMEEMFSGYVLGDNGPNGFEIKYHKFNQDITSWDTSKVISMNGMFKYSEFNQSIGNWDVSNVTNMAKMFKGSLFNREIRNWDVSKVEDMSFMFAGYLGVFNGVGKLEYYEVKNNFNKYLNTWNLSSLINPVICLKIALIIENLIIGTFQMLKFKGMFKENHEFNQDISTWDVSNVEYMSELFFEQNLINH